jgi:hypothetical protein
MKKTLLTIALIGAVTAVSLAQDIKPADRHSPSPVQ